MEFTPDQIDKLHQLGINVQVSPSLVTTPIFTQSKTKKKSPMIPLLSISGLTLLSFGGLILFKNKNTPSTTINPPSNTTSPTPTQVPKSIQHYLLTSQQFFTQAIQNQTEKDNNSALQNLNQSILAATDAIKSFPDDSRGYFQRGKIYLSLLDSQPKLIDQTIADLTTAQKLNPNSAEITHDLASVYARKGDTQNTINFLSQTISLDPTQAQNFYDLAKIQQQAGLIPQALDTYNRLLTLVTDANQKATLETEKTALEKLIAQNPRHAETSAKADPSSTSNPSPTISLPDNPPTIQAMANDTGLIIAAPESLKDIKVSNQTDSNSLSGTAILATGQANITIDNSTLTPNSQVYVVATKGGKNQNLKVISKSPDSFVVGFDSPLTEDVEFKWWIIN